MAEVKQPNRPAALIGGASSGIGAALAWRCGGPGVNLAGGARRGNSVYQASKAALSTYLDSLRYRLRGSGVRVVTVKPGYVATAMTGGARLPKPLVTPAEAVADRVARAVAHGRPGVVYIPGYWAPIMWVIRHLPSALIARLPL